jgi:hypothetical protein
MTVFFAGNEFECLTTFNGTVTTDASVALSGVNRAGIQFTGATQSGRAEFSAQTEGWWHFRYNRAVTGAAGTDTVASLRNSTDQALVNFTSTRNSVTSHFVSILGATAVAFPGGSTFDVDIHFKVAASGGFVKVYVNNSLLTESSGNTQLASGAQSISRFFMTAPVSGSLFPIARYSQLLGSSFSTLGSRVHTLGFSAGSVNDWIGAVTDINDTSNTPATLISADANNEEVLMAATDISSISSGNSITALVVSSAARAVSGSPVTNLIGRVKLGSTTYDLGSAVTLTDGFLPVLHILGLDPSTSAPWVASDINSAEIGLQAKT